jgi:hypothetical protein
MALLGGALPISYRLGKRAAAADEARLDHFADFRSQIESPAQGFIRQSRRQSSRLDGSTFPTRRKTKLRLAGLGDGE